MPAIKFRGVDFVQYDSLLTDEERLVRDTTRQFIEDNLIPIIEECNRAGRFPRELVKPMADLGFFGASLKGYGCAGMGNVEYARRHAGLEAQDLRIADHVLQEGRALIVAINKWDVAEGPSALFNGIEAALDEGLSQARGVPLLTVSGMTGKGIDQLLAAAFKVTRDLVEAGGDGAVNRRSQEAVEKNPPPAPGGKRIKLRRSPRSTRVRRASSCSARGSTIAGYLFPLSGATGIRREMDFGAVPVRLQVRASRKSFCCLSEGAKGYSSPDMWFRAAFTVFSGPATSTSCLPAPVGRAEKGIALEGKRAVDELVDWTRIFAHAHRARRQFRAHSRLFPRGRRESRGDDRGVADAPPGRRRPIAPPPTR